MSRRSTGSMFLCLAGFLYASRFFVAAIYGSNMQTWNSDLFNSLLQYTDHGLTTASITAFIIGAVYLIWAEVARQQDKAE